MGKLDVLFSNNQHWAAKRVADDPQFFSRLSNQQSPKYLWIGCADSRVPANEIIGLDPGEVFVHRNVANLVVHSDLNCLSVIEFAVAVLGVEDIMVVGHYGCGGVGAILDNVHLPLADNWLRYVGDIRLRHSAQLEQLPDRSHVHSRLCELNVIEQVVNVCRTSVVQAAWRNGKDLTIHGCIYGVHDGRIRNLNVTVSSPEQMWEAYDSAVNAGTPPTRLAIHDAHCNHKPHA